MHLWVLLNILKNWKVAFFLADLYCLNEKQKQKN